MKKEKRKLFRIQEILRLSEITKINGEVITPFYKVRENINKFQVSEDEMREYLHLYPKEYHKYIEQIMQKIYYPTENDQKKDDILKLAELN